MSKRLVRIVSQHEDSTMWICTNADAETIKQAISDANYGYERDLDWSTCFYDSIREVWGDLYDVEWVDSPETYYMD